MKVLKVGSVFDWVLGWHYGWCQWDDTPDVIFQL